jgi:hypothetical protein
VVFERRVVVRSRGVLPPARELGAASRQST